MSAQVEGRKWWHRLTGGRPMTRLDVQGFRDVVSGELVSHWRDAFGRTWMAVGRWLSFRVRTSRDMSAPSFAPAPESAHGVRAGEVSAGGVSDVAALGCNRVVRVAQESR